jgi:hypothetical protein
MTIDSRIAALFGALIGAAAAIGAQFLAARHDREQAKTARQQQRMERTYEDVMTTVNRLVLGVERTERMLTSEADPKPPARLTDGELNLLNARIGLYGSDRVRDLLAEFRDAQRRFIVAVGTHQDLKRTATTGRVEASQKVEQDTKSRV